MMKHGVTSNCLRLLITVLLVLVGSNSFSQAPSLTDQLDDLFAQYNVESSSLTLTGSFSPLDSEAFLKSLSSELSSDSIELSFLVSLVDLSVDHHNSSWVPLLDRGLQLALLLMDVETFVNLSYRKAWILTDVARYAEAIETLSSAVEIGNELPPERRGNILQAISHVYDELDDPASSLSFMRQSVALSELSEDGCVVSNAYLNFGAALADVAKLDSALMYYERALSVMDSTCLRERAFIHGNIASVKALQGNTNESIRWNLRALEDSMLVFDPVWYAHIFEALAIDYSKAGDRKKSSIFMEKAIQRCTEANRLATLAPLYLTKSELSQAAGNFEEALESLQTSIKLKDSLEGMSIQQLRVQFEEKYETDQKEAENRLLSLENQRQQQFLYVGSFVVLAVLVIALYIFYINKKTQKLNQKISAQSLELNRLNQTKDRLFSIIGHDLRSPITSFETLTSVISSYLKKGDTEKVQEVIELVDKSAKNLKLLLENLLNWSLSQQNEIQLDIKPISLKSVVDDVLEIYSETATLKQVTLTSTLTSEQVLADQDTLLTIIRNLISNALKYSPTGSEVVISQKPDGERLDLLVKDSGAGITPEIQQKLFTIDKSKVRKGTAKEKGTGLGLVLVKEFVEMNNGSISVQSSPKQGTTFCISLPIAP